MALDKIYDLLKHIAEQHKIERCTIEVKPVSSGGANYTSNLYSAKIINDEGVHNLFIKVAAMNENFRKGIPINVYALEQYVYTTMFKDFRDLEEKYKLSEDQKLLMPKYYGGSMTYMKETVVLEDLTARGFGAHDRRQSINWLYARSAIEELAKFHALSVAHRLQNPVKYQQFLDKFNHVWMNEDMYQNIFLPSLKMSLSVVKEEYVARVRKNLDGMNLDKMLEYYKPMKLKVIGNCDFRVSNMMHKENEDGSIQVQPIDYQTFQECGPITDLLLFIWTGTDQSFRRPHFQPLMHHYYSELSEALCRFGVDPDQVYSREDFQQELDAKMLFGLVWAACALPITTVDSENAPSIEGGVDLDGFCLTKPSHLLPLRMNEVVEDFIEWGLI